MSANWRLKSAVTGGVVSLALSAFGVSPAQADDQPPTGLVKVEVPADMEIVEATAPPAGTAPAGSATVLADHPCIGWTYAYGSTGCFQAYGDVIWAMDTKADGMSAAVIVNTNYGRAPTPASTAWGTARRAGATRTTGRVATSGYRFCVTTTTRRTSTSPRRGRDGSRWTVSNEYASTVVEPMQLRASQPRSMYGALKALASVPGPSGFHGPHRLLRPDQPAARTAGRAAPGRPGRGRRRRCR